jgi:threonine aldolase
MIDLRSDTVTRPTPAMLDAMLRARVGDDVFGDDETVNALQAKAAALFGKDAALFCPSGTMTNQIAVLVHTQRGDEVILHELSHTYRHEGGGIASNSGASVRLLTGASGTFTAEQVRANVNRRGDVHQPHSRLVIVENTANFGGGACWNFDEIVRIRTACDESGLGLHLDGARLFNALIARNEKAAAYGGIFDTISICLSKGLGAPVGSLLIGSGPVIERARRYRKVLGGGMRQAGFLAAAGIHALDHHVERLRLDHEKAKATARVLESLAAVTGMRPVETNIIIFDLADAPLTERFLAHLRQREVLAPAVGQNTVRFVFHLDVSDAQVNALHDALRSFAG